MSATFTDDDIEKTVKNASGEVIGTVMSVGGDTARVKPRAGIMDSIRATLGWRRSGGETVVIHESAIDAISSGAIRLAAETETTEPTSVDAAGSTVPDTTESTESEDTEPDRETHTDEPGHPGSIDDADEPAHGSEVEPDATAERDIEGETEEAPEENAAERPDESGPTDELEEPNATESPGTTDRGGVQDEPMGDTVEMPEDNPPETAEAGETESGDEPVDEPRTETEETSPVDEPRTETEETSPVDELDAGTDLESATETAETSDREIAGEASETESMDLADELDRSVDLESAVETDSRSEPTRDTRPETELDPDIDVDSSTAVDPRPENELNPDAGRTPATAESPDPAIVLDPGVDLETAMEPDQRSESRLDPDAVAGPETDTGSGTDAAAREIVPEGTAVTVWEIAAATDERPTGESAGEHTDRGRERRRSSSPLTAVLAVQRAAMTQGHAMVQQSLAAQQRAARGAVEFPLIAQRQGIDAARAATRRYVATVTALLETGTSASREQRRVLDEELADGIAAHLEELRALQSRFADRIEAGSEQAALLLERQVELLEECRRRLGVADK